MMRFRARAVITAVLFSTIVLSFIALKGDGIPDFLPQFGNFRFAESILQKFGRPKEQQSGASAASSQDGAETKPIETPQEAGEEWPNSDLKSTGGEYSNSGARKDLDHTLQKFLELPILSYRESLTANSKTCPTDQINFDRTAVSDNSESWPYISSTRILKWRQNIVAHMRRKQKEQEKIHSEGTNGGRGIVMAAGDHDAAIRARTNIRLLQSYNSTIPVEIFHFPGELSARERKLLASLSQSKQEGHEGMRVTLRSVKGVGKGNDWKQFHIKGAAIQQSSFDEILYLDTDSYPLRNPDYIFQTKQWNQTGLLLWPDYTKSHPTNPLWRLLGQQCRNEYEVESGQMFISRALHQDLMWLVEYFAVHHSEFYGFMGGDRDSFRAAALLLGKKWAGPGRINAAAGIGHREDAPGGGHTMLQADPEGKWLFVHANLIKHAHFSRPLWSRIQRATEDKFAIGDTYGNIDPPNDKVGDGVKLDVSFTPRMASAMTPFEGHSGSSVIIEDWDSYDELKGFEEKWFRFGGVN